MINSIQLLRAIAAYGVVLFHATEFIIANQPGANIFDFAIGAAGVDLFFVISGFVMVYVTKPSVKPSGFMLRRLIRIAPLYWVCTLCAILMVWQVPWSFQNVNLSWSTVLTSFAFLPMYNEAELIQPILFLGWTLNYEMFFYSVFAASLILPASLRLIGLFVGVFFAWFVASIFGSGAAGEFYGNTIVFEFLLGCGVAATVMNGAIMRRASRGIGLGLIFLAVLLFVAWPIFSEMFGATDRLWRWGLPSAILVLGAVILEVKSERRVEFPMQTLGDSSYSAYLLHPFIIITYGVVCLKVLPNNTLTTFALVAGIFLLTALSATISYRLIEQRFSAWLKAKIL